LISGFNVGIALHPEFASHLSGSGLPELAPVQIGSDLSLEFFGVVTEFLKSFGIVFENELESEFSLFFIHVERHMVPTNSNWI
jgi:hypothetical protein